MVYSEANPQIEHTKKKKRKLKGHHKEQRVSKAARVEVSKEVRESTEEIVQGGQNREVLEGHPWGNLQLILSLKNKDFEIQRKVKLAYDFVNSRANEESEEQNCETVSNAQLLVFLNDWIQSLLISSKKEVRVGGAESQSKVIGSCLDAHCWCIFKFCLESARKAHISLSFSGGLLRAIHCIAREALYLLNKEPLQLKRSLFIGEGFELYSTALDCISQVFTSHGGVSNANLDLWILTIDSVLKAVKKIYAENLDAGSSHDFFMQLSCFVLEPFAKFLRFHPCRKNGLRDFINKLLEPLLQNLHLLRIRLDVGNPEWSRNLLSLVKEVLSNGLFHSAHLDGFLALRSTGKYVAPLDGKQRDEKIVVVSYHRHLFDRLEELVAGEKELALGGIGELFHVFVDQAKCRKRVSVLSQGTEKEESSKHLEEYTSSYFPKLFPGNVSVTTKESSHASLNEETRKGVFDFFVKTMEPLLQKVNSYSQAKLEIGPLLSGVHCTLKSTNKLLVSCMHENVYLRMEDTSEGACLNFLKAAFDIIMTFSTKINQQWLSSSEVDKGPHMETLRLIVKELIVAVRYFLKIEYEVIGNDLVNLWLMMLSYLATDLFLISAPDQYSLASEILHLACQLIDLYSELRQVNNFIFSLCKAIRLLVCDGDDVMIDSKYMYHIPSLPNEAYAKSVEMLLCAQKFRFAICSAIKSIPEGQVAGCIRQLAEDTSESLEWLKVGSSVGPRQESDELEMGNGSLPNFDLKTELLGRALSEIYTMVLDSLTLTAGSSNSVRVSIEGLMSAIHPSMTCLVTPQAEGVNINEFLLSIKGRTSKIEICAYVNDMLKFRPSTCRAFLFFLRLYMSCRSLYREAMGLVPPGISKKMSSVMGDLSSGYSGRDFMESAECVDEGYFFWIAQSSVPLLTIIQSILDNYLQDSAADCSPLIYVLHAMAIQRLVDLNKQIMSLEYLVRRNDQLVQMKSTDDYSLTLIYKKSKRWKKYIAACKEEATGLTSFMMGYLPLVAQFYISIFGDVTSNLQGQHPIENYSWNLNVCTVNVKTLPTAIWLIICQNIDVWCMHAAKKKLKMFLSLILQTSIPYIKSSFGNVVQQKISELDHPGEIGISEISMELLRDTVLYEQKFVCRYFASTLCRIVKKSIIPIFCNSLYGHVDISISPNWHEVLSALEDSQAVVSGNKRVLHKCSSVKGLKPHSHSRLQEKSYEDQKAFSVISTAITTCQSLFNLLCWMPKGYLSSRSISCCATHILNLERLVVGSLLDRLLVHNHYELVRLLVFCRRAFNHITVASYEEKVENGQFPLTDILFEGPLPVLWLLKSVHAVVALQHASSEDGGDQVKDMIFSLVDHTSCLFLTLSKAHFRRGAHYLVKSDKAKAQHDLDTSCEQSGSVELSSCLDSYGDIEAWRSMMLVAKTLEEKINSLLVCLKDSFSNDMREEDISIVDSNQLSSTISCIQGVLWGLASTLNRIEAKSGNLKGRLNRWKYEPLSELNVYIDMFADSINFLSCMLFFKDNQWPENLKDVHSFLRSDYKNSVATEKSSVKGFTSESNNFHRTLQDKSGVESGCAESSEICDHSEHSRVRKKRLPLENVDSAATVLAEFDSFGLQCLNRPFLRSLLKGEHPEAAFLVRQLFTASSAILRLKLLINSTPLSSRLVPTFVGVSQFFLFELSNMVDVPPSFSFVWLDGVLKYLEEVGGHFPITNPTLSTNMYGKLVDLQLRAIGKCISLQGKRATLASHETESSTKILDGHIGLHQSSLPHGSHCVDEFKTRLRMSFKQFIKKPSELHLLSTLQALERALVGVQEGFTMVYQINTGSAGGGKVSSIVAAGIDCLDLVLEFVSGRKHLDVVKEHIQNLTCGLFNIILHLHGPHIFYENLVHNKGLTDPDSGSVILMSVEVLTRIFGRHASYKLGSCHVAQSLRVPAMLFRGLHELRLSKAPSSSDTVLPSNNKSCETVASGDPCTLDHQFSICLYAACCRLLHTVIKHHKSECEQCIAVLQDSVCVLLSCLEREKTDSAMRNGDFSWELSGITCASFLRRIYEELRQQKDVFGKHSFEFLSSYIWIYSGSGSLRTGIKRKVDEALRPGVYALIDACSADDLQYLHTVFGEGPCRNTLAALQHDYKLNFQYQGKV